MRCNEPEDLKVSNSHSPEDPSLIDVAFLAARVSFRHLGYLVTLNLYFWLLSIPILTFPGAKTALHRLVYDFLFDPHHKAANPLQGLREQLRPSFAIAFFLELLKDVVLIFIVVSIAFWSAREDSILRLITILALYGLVVWWIVSSFLYPVLAYRQGEPAAVILNELGRLVASKPFAGLFFSVVSALLLLIGVVLLGPILLVIPALRAVWGTLGYHFLTGSNFDNVRRLASKDW